MKLLAIFMMLWVSSLLSAAEDYRYTCYMGKDQRIIDVDYTGKDKVPCEVRYTKSSGTEVVWWADNQAGFCEAKAEAFVEKQKGWGWKCSGVAVRERLKTTAKRDDNNGWIDMIVDPDETFDEPFIDKPPYLQTIVDPVFNTRVTRITGDPGTGIVSKNGDNIGTWGTASGHHYSKDQPWNADQSLIHLTKNEDGSPEDLFLDGNTYEVLFSRSVPGDSRWHRTDPHKKIYVGKNRIGLFDVTTGEDEIIFESEDYKELYMGPWEGNLSNDGCWVVIHAEKADKHDGSGWDNFAYDLCKREKHKAVDVGLSVRKSGWISVSASGEYIVLHVSDTDNRVYDREMNYIISLPENISHFDLGIDDDGEDVAVGVSKKSDYSGQVIKYRLRDAKLTELTFQGYSSHSSARNTLLPGWSYHSYPKRDRQKPYRDEIISVKMDGSGEVRRFCHIHSTKGEEYLSEAQGVPSPDGKRVMFRSDWDNQGEKPIQAYICDARAPS